MDENKIAESLTAKLTAAQKLTRPRVADRNADKFMEFYELRDVTIPKAIRKMEKHLEDMWIPSEDSILDGRHDVKVLNDKVKNLRKFENSVNDLDRFLK